jgi:hypothetical protein
MILIQSLLAGASFGVAVSECVNLSKQYHVTVILLFNGSAIIFNPNDGDFIQDLYGFYDNQRKENSIKKMIEIGRLLNN